MAMEVSQDEEISGGGKNVGRKGACSAIRRRRPNRESVNIKKRENKEEWFREVLTPK